VFLRLANKHPMKTLFAFTFSPVQDFIKEARRGQDLFAGSYILAQLSSAALDALKAFGAGAIYPHGGNEADNPNKLLLSLEDKRPESAAQVADAALFERWRGFVREFEREATSWRIIGERDDAWSKTWDRQKDGPWQTFWAAADYDPDDNKSYSEAVKRVNWLLDADKRTRTFPQSEEPGPKDTLSGARTALASDRHPDPREFWRAAFDNGNFNAAKLRPNGRERLDVQGAVKRFGIPDATLPNILSTSSVCTEDFLMRAGQNAPDQLRDYRGAVDRLLGADRYRVRREVFGWPYDGDLFFVDGLTKERLANEYGVTNPGERHLVAARKALQTLHEAVGAPSTYFAVLSLDGDSMGERVSELGNEIANKEFSKKVAGFAGQVQGIVETYQGQKVYAGGDDVLALLPLSKCVIAADELIKLFVGETGNTASAGIAIVHHMAPLDQALEQSRIAEGRAKKVERIRHEAETGDPIKTRKHGLSIHIDKRSGAPLEIALQAPEIAHLQMLIGAYHTEVLSAKFANDARALADRYWAIDGISNFADNGQRLAAFRSQVRYQLAQHYKDPPSQNATFSRDGVERAALALLDAQGDPAKAGDSYLIARFIGSRGAE
jgi:CRISPR-associated protein Cmr2